MPSPYRDDLLRDRTVLVTGGGSGLGLSMAKGFADAGARLALTGRTEAKLERALAELPGSGHVAVPANVRDPESVEAMVGEAWDRLGGIDVVVNNAAANFLAATEDLSANGFDAIVQTVLYGTFHVTSAAGKRMIERGEGGTFLNIVTTYAWTGSAFVVPSAAAKAGVLAMTRSLAVEWAEYGIRLNAIAPGPFPTEGAWKRLMPTKKMEKEARARVPMNRFGEHEELGNLATFLVSDAAPYVNGECVTIDGGEWLASGGQFNGVARMSRTKVKLALKAMRGK